MDNQEKENLINLCKKRGVEVEFTTDSIILSHKGKSEKLPLSFFTNKTK